MATRPFRQIYVYSYIPYAAVPDGDVWCMTRAGHSLAYREVRRI